jgi:hypothetical protein
MISGDASIFKLTIVILLIVIGVLAISTAYSYAATVFYINATILELGSAATSGYYAAVMINILK